jgi:hypothetical protein
MKRKITTTKSPKKPSLVEKKISENKNKVVQRMKPKLFQSGSDSKLTKKELVLLKKKKQREKSKEIQINVADSVPRSLIYHKGKVAKKLVDLEKSIKSVMYPYTSLDFKLRPNDKFVDLVEFGKVLPVSHLIEFTTTVVSSYMKVMR